MRVVYKYPLQVPGKIFQVLQLPAGSEPLYVQSKSDGDFLYVLVPLGETGVEQRRFLVAPTGMVLDVPLGRCLGPILSEDYYIFHVFEAPFPSDSSREVT